MRAHLGSKAGDVGFDLKHDRGGIVDIEFMVQYQVQHMRKHTQSLRLIRITSDSSMDLRISGCISTVDADALKRAYVRYRTLTHEAT